MRHCGQNDEGEPVSRKLSASCLPEITDSRIESKKVVCIVRDKEETSYRMNNGEVKKLSDLKPEELTDAELEQTAGGKLIIHCSGQFEAYQIFCPKCGSDEIIFLDGHDHRNDDGEFSHEGVFTFSSSFFQLC